MNDLINISIPTAGGYAVLGYAVVFFGLLLLMCVIMSMGKIMVGKTAKVAPAAEFAAVAPAEPAVPPKEAPGTAGEFKLYNTDPRDAAMVMAIVANELGKPLNELRFISIREVKEDEI